MNNVIICFLGSVEFDKAARGLAAAGRRLADELGVPLRAIVMGNREALAAGVVRVANTVIVADQPELSEYTPETCLDALTQLCKEAGAVLLSNDSYSQEIAARLAHRLGGSAVGDGTEVRPAGTGFRVTRQVYGGKAQAIVQLKRSPAVVWLRSRAFAPTDTNIGGEIQRVVLELKAKGRIRLLESKREEGTQARLEDAQIIVAGGRGLGGPAPFTAELQPLADLLQAQMAASRAACDAGWVPPTWQVGQTGKKVAPELYLAIGISGSSQHMAGVSEAKNIAAINTDPEAAIFKHCRFGIVADYKKVVPLLREKLRVLSK